MATLLLTAILFWSISGTSWIPESPTKSFDCRRYHGLPDRSCTPGGILTQDVFTICQSGYAASVRDVNSATRKSVLEAYDDVDPPHGAYELDHLIPLELGGSNDAANLWPEPALGARNSYDKDLVEDALRRAVCGGSVSLVSAQQLISSDWRTAFPAALLI